VAPENILGISILSPHANLPGAEITLIIQRPFLADPFFVKKAMEGRADEINSCIGCNQVSVTIQLLSPIYVDNCAETIVLRQLC